MLMIDYYKIKENIKELLKRNELVVVLKNNAYCFNLKRVLKIALSLGVSRFAVNDFNEAKEIREVTSDAQIILFGPYNKFYDYLKYNVFPTATTISELLELESLKIPYCVKINSSMNRFGIKDIDMILGKEYIKGIYVHMPKINDELIDKANRLGIIATLYNISYSVGGGIFKDVIDYPIRVGGMLYSDCRRMYGHILQIKSIKKGQPIGYESNYIAPNDHLYAIVDIGYYNGLDRYFDGDVFINGRLYKAIGLVCMNHMFILADEMIFEGALVEFFGINIPIDEFLAHNRMTLYESFICLK